MNLNPGQNPNPIKGFKLPKIVMIGSIIGLIGTILGLIGGGIGIYAAMNPQGVFNFLQKQNILNIGKMFPQELTNPEVLSQELVKTGKTAKAKIVALEDTGNTFNMMPVVKMTFEVEPGVQVVITQPIARVNLPSVGQYAEILYDPNDLTKAAIK
ncbi:MAG: hypothetical protein WC843_02370 [Candidatus Gracilibacteria bacterium]|jgi:hypothetical protein